MVNVVTTLCDEKPCILHTKCVFVLKMTVKTDTDYFPDRTKLFYLKRTQTLPCEVRNKSLHMI
jgi:hypothetical protein